MLTKVSNRVYYMKWCLMGKTKQKQRSEINYLKGIINSLKKEIKILKAQQNRVSAEDEPDDRCSLVCPACTKGELEILDLKRLIIYSCTLCEFKHKEKI